MGTTIAVANQKGGVGKTTTSHNIGVGLALKGFKVLLVDIDSQANLTSVCDCEVLNGSTMYEVFKNVIGIKEVIVKINDNLDLAPSNITLAGIEAELMNVMGREYRLKEILESVKDDYDYIIIDTPGSLGILTINAFTASNSIIIPTTASMFAIQGMSQLNDIINTVIKYSNKDLNILGILITRYNSRTNVTKELLEVTNRISELIDAPILETKIRNSIVVEETQMLSTSVFDHKNKNSVVSEDYALLVDEIINK